MLRVAGKLLADGARPQVIRRVSRTYGRTV